MQKVSKCGSPTPKPSVHQNMHSVRLIVNQACIDRDVRGVGGESARRASGQTRRLPWHKTAARQLWGEGDQEAKLPTAHAAASSPLCSATSHFVGTVLSLHCFQSSIKRLAPCIRQRQAAVGICKQRRRRSHLSPARAPSFPIMHLFNGQSPFRCSCP